MYLITFRFNTYSIRFQHHSKIIIIIDILLMSKFNWIVWRNRSETKCKHVSAVLLYALILKGDKYCWYKLCQIKIMVAPTRNQKECLFSHLTLLLAVALFFRATNQIINYSIEPERRKARLIETDRSNGTERNVMVMKSLNRSAIMHPTKLIFIMLQLELPSAVDGRKL